MRFPQQQSRMCDEARAWNESFVRQMMEHPQANMACVPRSCPAGKLVLGAQIRKAASKAGIAGRAITISKFPLPTPPRGQEAPDHARSETSVDCCEGRRFGLAWGGRVFDPACETPSRFDALFGNYPPPCLRWEGIFSGWGEVQEVAKLASRDRPSISCSGCAREIFRVQWDALTHPAFHYLSLLPVLP